MHWIVDNIEKGIWKFFADLCTDILNAAFKLITETILNTTNPSKYIDVTKYLMYSQALAASLLVFTVVWQGFKQQSGGVFNSTERSISTITLRTAFAGALIFILPWSVTGIFLPINNTLVELIQSIGIKVTESKFKGYVLITDNLANLGGLMIIMTLVLAISFLVLAIAGGIRCIELFICIIFAPFAAISLANEGEALQVWVRETTCIVFTQAIHILLLQVLMTIMGSVKDSIMMIVLSTGTVVVMLKGPQILRKYLYSSGVGSAGMGAVGSAGRMAVMKYAMKSPVS